MSKLTILSTHHRHFPLCFDDGVLYSRCGKDIYCWGQLPGEPRHVAHIRPSKPGGLLGLFRPTERLFRLGISHLVVLGHRMVAVYNKEVHLFDNGVGSWRCVGQLNDQLLGLAPGGRPMRFGVTADQNGDVYLGEYYSNKERGPVRVLTVDGDGRLGTRFKFPSGTVRHVHAIHFDPFSGDLWLTTGDYGQENRIFRSDDGCISFQLVGSGDQSWRTTCLLFKAEAVFWGMDSPLERCFVFRWDRRTKERTAVSELPGPVWHGATNEAGWLMFSTAAEPTLTLGCPEATIFAAQDGKPFEQVAHYRKDRWPSILQFGLVYFPTGTAPDDLVVFATSALQGADNTMFIARIWS